MGSRLQLELCMDTAHVFIHPVLLCPSLGGKQPIVSSSGATSVPPVVMLHRGCGVCTVVRGTLPWHIRVTYLTLDPPHIWTRHPHQPSELCLGCFPTRTGDGTGETDDGDAYPDSGFDDLRAGLRGHLCRCKVISRPFQRSSV